MIKEFSDEVTFQRLCSMQSYVSDFHIHNFYELFILLHGEIEFYIQDSRYRISSGTLVIINDLEIHKTVNISDSPFERIYIHIPPSFFFRHISDEIDLSACFKSRNINENNFALLNDSQINYIVQQYELMNAVTEYPSNGRKLLLESYLLQLLIFVNNMSPGASAPLPQVYSKNVQNIIQYLHFHLLDDITLDQLAEHFSLSKYHMCHIFKREMGTSIQNYLFLCRISRAKALLAEGKNVTEACYQSGFNTYTNFITSFRRCTGYSPKKYQQMHQQFTLPDSLPTQRKEEK